MTLKRRLDAVETSLSPTQLVLRWLADAHAFGDLEPYVASLLAADPPVASLDRLAREAVQGARTAMRGKRPEVVEAAVRSALRETVFRYELVLRINLTAHDLVDREALIDMALSARVALVAGEAKLDPGDRRWLGTLRDLVLFRVSELNAAGEARARVEQRYLDGHPALFPDLSAAWEEQVKSTTGIANMAVRLAEIHGVAASAPTNPEAVSDRTTELVADLVEPAKAETLEMLGEGRQALGVSAGWVRARLQIGRRSGDASDLHEASAACSR
jgi:hypothetical protein